ncbi:MAG TPA: FAD-dependent thymidylate synthase [Anaerolineales bacterium]|nr:FAD-dependent thymidylate synthase [Anaerolineales bacterium]
MSDTHPRQVYLLSPRSLSPETIAVTFAKTSRSPLSFREIAAELTDEKSSEFHEKWVVGYGHASVAEHAVLHIAFENVSRLAIETIESNRLASYTEKSTRYQRWDADSFYVPLEVIGTEHEDLYRSTCRELFEAYLASLEPVRKVVQGRVPRNEGESDARWDGRIRARYVDVCRFLLPAAALANVGMTANARTLEHAIRKMLSHPLDEVRQAGLEMRQAASAEVPTLLKYADPTPYARAAERRLQEVAAELEGPAEEAVRLVAYDLDGEDRVLAAALYPSAQAPYEAVLDNVRGQTAEGRRRLAEAMLGGRGAHDVPLRALEHTAYTFEVVVDQGGYFELKRHRMMTQTPQRLTTGLGYSVPALIVDAGLGPEYRQALDRADRSYRKLAAWNAEVAAYLVPNACRRRVLLTANLREIFHFCELRSAANAHFSIRRIALGVAEAVRRVHPSLASYLRLPEGADRQSLESEHFAEV